MSQAFHKDSIWTIDPSSNFMHVFTGGRDGNIYRVNITDGTIDLIYQGSKDQPIISLKYDE